MRDGAELRIANGRSILAKLVSATRVHATGQRQNAPTGGQPQDLERSNSPAV